MSSLGQRRRKWTRKLSDKTPIAWGPFSVQLRARAVGSQLVVPLQSAVDHLALARALFLPSQIDYSSLASPEKERKRERDSDLKGRTRRIRHSELGWRARCGASLKGPQTRVRSQWAPIANGPLDWADRSGFLADHEPLEGIWPASSGRERNGTGLIGWQTSS